MGSKDLSTPHIGLNAHLLGGAGTYRAAGIHSYIYHLIRHLPQADARFSYTAFMRRQSGADFPGIHTCLSPLPTERPWVRIFWEQTLQPWALRRCNVALVHGLAFALPVVAPCPMIVTVYDLSFFRLPQYFRPWNRLYLKFITRHSVRRAAIVIAISQSTKREIMDILGIPGAKIHVIPPGKNPVFRPVEDREAVTDFRRRRDLPDRMIFYLGTLEPRKNLVVLLRAYARLRAMKPSAPALVIGGAKGWYYEQIYATVEQLGLTGKVLLPGYIPTDELLWWYNAADCFVYPSLYEGFGMPVVEAMACGTPVVTSNVTSLPEVVGNAGLTVSPTSAEQLAQAMSKALYDSTWRESAHDLGIQRAAQFSWLEAAKQTTQLYHKVLGRVANNEES